MQILDWIVLFTTIVSIVAYGLYKSKGKQNIGSYLKAENTLPWYTISLSIIATQASAVTFLSAPGQAYTDGMRFVLFYLGLPVAMVVLSAFVLPIYYKLKVFTAYEFLESKFNRNTRVLTAFLFLIQRGLAAGISLAAPSIVLSAILNWNIYLVNLFIGLVVIFYTVTGGSQAVSQTQKLQMIVILSGMGIAGYLVVAGFPSEVSMDDAMHIAGKAGKLNTMDFAFDWDNKYNFWSGLIGGFFLQMAYFGTDQSQVGRYLGGRSLRQSRLGLLFNGVFKIPMQFGILFIGAMLFIFYQFEKPPLFFNQSEVLVIKESQYAKDYEALEKAHEKVFLEKKQKVQKLIDVSKTEDNKALQQAKTEFLEAEQKLTNLRTEAQDLIKKNKPTANTNDTNYIFLTFVTDFLPVGLVGLLIAVILSASMSTTASELSALSSTTVMDIYKRSINQKASEEHYLKLSKWLIVFWGFMAIIFAQLATQVGTLIEIVNILGSLFYGTILGVFVLAFITKKLKAWAAFWAIILGETLVILIFSGVLGIEIAYLWLNMIGAIAVIVFAFLIDFIGQFFLPKT